MASTSHNSYYVYQMLCLLDAALLVAGSSRRHRQAGTNRQAQVGRHQRAPAHPPPPALRHVVVLSHTQDSSPQRSLCKRTSLKKP